ncbi:TRAP-type C4-dicarboxylate transport system permease large subunit [Acinetobacter calcoaceticus]|uniref:TRAP-type C4-dicarboxylate transport system permease large subunit n=1 Tax=Acinetobacter calcoaceticus TaxID=471 RepID=A0A4R1Y123_ACICA|nr:TRAP-type C4-dicarboxylate transport system permease large subunit [Acinetobacter calcoaceticus]
MKKITDSRPVDGRFFRLWNTWISTFAVMVLLVLTLVIGTGEMIHGQLLRIGETLYGDPEIGMQYSFLRAEPEAPSCDPNPNVDALVQQQMQSNAKDEFADIFGTASAADVRESVLAAQQQCQEKYTFYQTTQQYLEQHSSLRSYRNIETGFFWLFKFGTENRVSILLLMVMISAITASIKMHHISLRPAKTKLDFQVYHLFMILGNGLLSYSVISQYLSVLNSGVAVNVETHTVYCLWLILFISLTLISALQWFRIPSTATAGGKLGLALLSVPLFAMMAVVTGIAFSVFMDYPMGQGIYLGQLVEYSGIFLNLALFIWAGMLLTQTRIMDVFLAILRPWNLTPEILTFLILIAAAIPTAYTGASGIFVIAAGALIYKEVWNSGARRQYALAVSAMSGSLGVVLRPCLLIILISMLDSRHVTSDELFQHGHYVFWLTALIFLAVSLVLAKEKFRINSPKQALPAMGRALLAVVPYVLLILVVLAFYRFGLDTPMDEFTAPVILPIMLLGFIYFDKRFGHLLPVASLDDALSRQHQQQSSYLQGHTPDAKQRGKFSSAVRFATAESVGHIGALIILMALSASMGGLIERSDMVSLLPTHLGSLLLTLGFIALLLALIGMCTDPFGAVILVAGSIAPVAYANGIHAIHFWMIVLVAFEFGYVTPPVALNHLLTRLSVGDAEMAAADAEAKQHYRHFYYRYERWILPMMVLFTSLMLVTYLPYALNLFGWYPNK